ncbi:MAG: 6,7-dimethyl-8-ribityllumazine synthase [Rhodospirillum sp.]|nr:6,7-dimethyl-8-ribityllumazine synthase [Rhodospirillum sp.]MCF8488870.1 6,7-dimethyl-8-ribityllumazine synthase [Rhodospirillum sp.]MCF8502756.1 6,7-dimethyl-8-ribityllumazine synthase [Rhodospirillum sp.]
MTGRYGAVVAAAFVVDGGIYRHDFVAQTVVDGLMRAGLDSGVPVLSVSLTPHHYQETDHHKAIQRDHFVVKDREAAEAAFQVQRTRARIAA